ncbi:MAG: 3-dehydroquinate synthase II, partial [Deltaproteobacteria bacterium]|nr:3-dehydroquinate synthase II [Deltaproteobacteria bacterium]
MKQVWVKIIPWGAELAQAAMESGADALWVEAGIRSEVKKMGLIPTVAEDGDYVLGRDVVEKEVVEKKDEEEIVNLSFYKKVVVKGKDWTIIPLENLLSRAGNIFVEIADLQEGKTAFSILEKGVDGVVLNQSDPQKVRQIIRQLKAENERFELWPARVKSIEPLGLGDRVCVDTCSSMV